MKADEKNLTLKLRKKQRNPKEYRITREAQRWNKKSFKNHPTATHNKKELANANTRT